MFRSAIVVFRLHMLLLSDWCQGKVNCSSTVALLHVRHYIYGVNVHSHPPAVRLHTWLQMPSMERCWHTAVNANNLNNDIK